MGCFFYELSINGPDKVLLLLRHNTLQFSRKKRHGGCSCSYDAVDVLVLGIANLVADGISMAFGDYVSSSTEKDMAARERLATEREITNHAQRQQMELLRTYQALGMDPEDAMTVS